jgi:hypothetical protein
VEDNMKNKGLAIGAAVLAVVVFAIGIVLQHESDFSNNYVKDQLTAHAIRFTPAAGLMPAQQKVPCLVHNAGKPLTTGKQAECYALYQIGIDLTMVDHGKTYFQDHYNGYLERQKMYTALKSDPNAQRPATQAVVERSQRADAIANDLLAGEATKGLLLSAYGFSILGDRAGQAATACFVIAGMLALAALALFVASRRRRTVQLATHAPVITVTAPADITEPVPSMATGRATEREPVGPRL